jgi:hypothetical protein
LADAIYAYLVRSPTEFSVFFEITCKQTHVPRDRERVIEHRRLVYDCPLDNGRHDNIHLSIFSFIKYKLSTPEMVVSHNSGVKPKAICGPDEAPALPVNTFKLNASGLFRSLPLNLRVKPKAICGPDEAPALPVNTFKLNISAPSLFRSLHLDFIKPKAACGPHFGTLSAALPHHIIEYILDEYVDIASLTTLRRVNREVRRSINALPKYQAVMEHAPGVIRAALSIEVASAFTARDLWLALISKKCTYCSDFGAFIYLPTATRVCFACNLRSPYCLPMDLAAILHYYALDKSDLVRGGVTIASPLPGIYHTLSQDGMNMTGLVDRTAAAKLAAKLYNVGGNVYQ